MAPTMIDDWPRTSCDCTDVGGVAERGGNVRTVANLGLKVFSATKARDRELLGETITTWIRAHPSFDIIDKIVTQSSDAEFHCLAITIFYCVKLT